MTSVTSANSTSTTEQHISTDRQTIRKWADRHNAVPVWDNSDRTLDLVPKSRFGAKHEQLDWDTFYDELESDNHAVSYYEGANEAPFEVMNPEQALSQSDFEAQQIRNRLLEGETVTSTIQETSAIETAVIEEVTVESELVGREIIHEELLDVDLEERTCTGFSVISSADFEDAETFDHDRYFASLEASRGENTQTARDESSVEPSLPYTTADNYQTQIDIREVWTPSREVTERFTVESRITETDIAEAETFEDYDLDFKGLQRSIVEQGMLGVEHDPDKVMNEFEIESELDRGDQIHTHFTRTSVVEDEVIDKIRARADINRLDFADMDSAAADHVVSEDATETMRFEAGRMSLTGDDVGKDVTDVTGSKVGTVKEITDGGQTAYVDPHSSITERIMSALGWSDEDENEGEMEIYVGQFVRITHEEIRLKEYEQLAEHRQVH